MKLKQGVRLTGLAPQMVVAALIAHDAFGDAKADCIITSANDSTHGKDSLHSRDGLCRALDFRTKHITSSAVKRALAARIVEDLGADFDVVLEHLEEDNEHLHIEWDPKGV